MSTQYKRRDFLRFLGFGAVSLTMPGCNSVAGLSTGVNKQPNIILIMADDMGYSDIGCYGGANKNPYLKKHAPGGGGFHQL